MSAPATAAGATASEEECHDCHAVPTEKEKALKHCAVCKTVLYCSDECQKNDLNAHKKSCTKIAGKKLLLAICENDLDTVRRLAKTKRVVNCRVDYRPPREEFHRGFRPRVLEKWAPLHECVRKQRVEAMKILLEHGANVEIKDVDGETPLFIAASASNVELLKLLIQAGANPNATSGEDWWSPLMMASRDRKREHVQALLDAGADPERGSDILGRTAFDLAVQGRG